MKATGDRRAGYSHSIISQLPNPLLHLRLCASHLSNTVRHTAPKNRWRTTESDRSRKQVLHAFAFSPNIAERESRNLPLNETRKKLLDKVGLSEITSGRFYEREYDLLLLEPDSLTQSVETQVVIE